MIIWNNRATATQFTTTVYAICNTLYMMGEGVRTSHKNWSQEIQYRDWPRAITGVLFLAIASISNHIKSTVTLQGVLCIAAPRWFSYGCKLGNILSTITAINITLIILSPTMGLHLGLLLQVPVIATTKIRKKIVTIITRIRKTATLTPAVRIRE